MTYDMGNADKLQLFVEEARRCGIAMRRPSVNRSDVEFVPEDGAIRFSLAALKTVGRGVVESLVAVRAEGGPFTDLGEFARRIDAKSVNRRVLEALIAAGALDDLNSDRGLLHANAENILAIAHRTAEDRDAGQNDLFGSGSGTKPEPLQLLPAQAMDHVRDAGQRTCRRRPVPERPPARRVRGRGRQIVGASLARFRGRARWQVQAVARVRWSAF